MSQNGTENTEIISQDEDEQYTGQTCSPNPNGSENTEIISQDEDVHLTGQTCSPFDPDVTYIDESLLRKNKCPAEESELMKAGDLIPSTEPGRNLSATYSQESTQPVTQSQEPQSSPPSKSDVTLELSPTVNSQNCAVGRDDNCTSHMASHTLSQAETLELKLSDDLRGGNSLVGSSSTSSSQIASSSSSSKRPTESDDTDGDDIGLGSQDMFASQGTLPCSQKNTLTVSQFLPTLQLSGATPSSQGYEGFLPPILHPSSPTSSSTSTPLRKMPNSIPMQLRGEVIPPCTEEDVQKLNEKRKHSDSSDESKPDEKRAKMAYVDNRQSIVVVAEISSAKKQSFQCSPDNSKEPASSLDRSLDSQAFSLYLSQMGPDGTGSQSSEDASPLSNSKLHTESTNENEPSATVPSVDDSVHSEQNISVVQLDDMEDEIQFISPPAVKSASIGEIQILDASGPQTVLSTSADVQVLSPLENNSNNSKADKRVCGAEKLSFMEEHNVCFSQEMKDTFEDSKENVRPENNSNIIETHKEFLVTFSCTYRLSCKTAIDMVKKETVSNSIPLFEVLQSKTEVKRDSSPSAVEESSPGRGGGSPGSVASGPGPFRLQPSHAARLSMFSTTSSSSTGSSASAYRQAQLDRFSIQARQRRGKDSPSKQVVPAAVGPFPWRELVNQKQDELAASVAPFLEKWESSLMNNSSSDDSKTVIEDKVLDTVLEDDGEVVLGVPPSLSKKRPISNLAHRKKVDAMCNGSTTLAAQMDPQNEDDKMECVTPTGKRRKGRPPKAATPSGRSSTKKKAPTPRKKGPAVPAQQDQSTVVEDSSLSSGSCYFAPGTSVFAVWERNSKKKKHYYPGTIDSPAQGNLWNIVFHDKAKAVLSKSEFLIINTFEIGQSVCVLDKGQYHDGKVTDVTPLKGGDDLFTVEISSSGQAVTVPISDLCLSEEQAQHWMYDRPDSALDSSSPSKRTSASKCKGSDQEILKNLDLLPDLPGKRIRTPKNQAAVSSPGRPGPSNTARRLIQSCGSSTADEEPLASALAKEKVGPDTVVTGVEPEQKGFGSADPLARKGKGVKNSASKKPLPDIDNEEIVQQLGPIPPDGSQIFSGYSFLLTKTDNIPKPREPVTDSEMPSTDTEEHHGSDGSSTYPSDSENFKFTRCPIVKDRLARQITQGGGKLIRHWKDIVSKDINKTFVISNRPCLTPTFLHCLVRGVKGVNHDFIIECCKQNQKFAKGFKNNLLPLGFSHVRRGFVNWHDVQSKLSKSPLKGEVILVAGDADFKAFWEEYLDLTGADVHSAKKSKGMHLVTKVISDKTCSDTILKHSEDSNIPVLSPAWVTQSLIEYKNLSCSLLPWFSYNFDDS